MHIPMQGKQETGQPTTRRVVGALWMCSWNNASWQARGYNKTEQLCGRFELSKSREKVETELELTKSTTDLLILGYLRVVRKCKCHRCFLILAFLGSLDRWHCPVLSECTLIVRVTRRSGIKNTQKGEAMNTNAAELVRQLF